MSLADWHRVLDFVQTLIWPLVIVFIVVFFRDAITQLIHRVDRGNVGLAESNARSVETATALGAAEAIKAGGYATTPTDLVRQVTDVLGRG